MNAPVITHPREQLRQLREKLAEAAQRIIDALDYLDGDSDLEAVGDENEPSLATMDGRNHIIDFAGDTDDREDEHDGREEFLEGEDNEDREPDEFHECGDTPFSMNQEGTNWAYGDRRATYIQPAVDRRALSAATTGRAADIQHFETDGKGNATFTLDGVPRQRGALLD